MRLRAPAAAVLACTVALALALSAPAVAALQSVAAHAGDDAVRPGRWSSKKPPAGWVVSDTPHYQVQSQCGKEKAKALAGHLESMLDLYQRFLPSPRRSEPFVLKLFRNRQEYVQYYAPGDGSSIAAHYDPEAREIVAYDTGLILGVRDVPAQIGLRIGVADRLSLSERQQLDPLFDAITDAWTMDTAGLLSHEGWHQYFHAWTVSVVEMPAWLDEGIGDWFTMARRDPDRDATHGYRLGDLNPFRLRTLKRAVFEGTTVPFATLLGYSQKQFYGNPAVSYAQGWSMVHFLMQHVDARTRALIPKLLIDFKDSKNFQQSTQTVFDGIDLAALDREWMNWVRAQSLHDPMMDMADAYGGKLKANDLLGEKSWTSFYQWYVGHPDALSAAAPEADAPATGDPAHGAPAGGAPGDETPRGGAAGGDANGR